MKMFRNLLCAVAAVVLVGTNAFGDGLSAPIGATPTGGTFWSTFQSLFAERSLTIFDFKGAAADGTTDNYAAFSAACASKHVLIPPGTYKIVVPSGGKICTSLAGASFDGADRDTTILNIVGTGTSYFEGWRLTGSAVAFRNMTINFAPPIAGQGALFGCNGGTGLELNNVHLVGNTTISGGANTNSTYIIDFIGDCSNVLVSNSEWSGWGLSLLKTNAATSTQSHLQFVNDYGHDNSGDALQFNSPNGTMTDVEVNGGKYQNGGGLSCATTGSQLISFSNVQGFRVHGARLSGTTDGDAIHIEDASTGTITSNSFHVTSPCTGSGNAIALYPNAISGNLRSPTDVTANDNSIVGYGSNATYGVLAAFKNWTQLSGGTVNTAGSGCNVGETITLSPTGGKQAYPATVTVATLTAGAGSGVATVTYSGAGTSAAGWFTSNPTAFTELSASGTCTGFSISSPTFTTAVNPQSAVRLVANDNAIEGVGTGIYLGYGTFDSVIQGNTIAASAVDIYSFNGGLGIKNNTLTTALVGLESTKSAMFGVNKFSSGVVNGVTTNPVTAMACAITANNYVTLPGFDYTYTGVNIGSNTVVLPMSLIPNRVFNASSTVTVSVPSGASSLQYQDSPITFDGTTLTDTLLGSVYPGGGSSSRAAMNITTSTVLNFRAFFNVDANPYSVQAQFSGEWLFSKNGC